MEAGSRRWSPLAAKAPVPPAVGARTENSSRGSSPCTAGSRLETPCPPCRRRILGTPAPLRCAAMGRCRRAERRGATQCAFARAPLWRQARVPPQCRSCRRRCHVRRGGSSERSRVHSRAGAPDVQAPPRGSLAPPSQRDASQMSVPPREVGAVMGALKEAAAGRRTQARNRGCRLAGLTAEANSGPWRGWAPMAGRRMGLGRPAPAAGL
jgi:hypothetical protein